MHPDPKSPKNTVKPSVFFALLGSAHVKAEHKMLVKSTIGHSFFAPKKSCKLEQAVQKFW